MGERHPGISFWRVLRSATGLFIGGCAGMFMSLRARYLDNFGRIAIETGALTTVAAVVITNRMLGEGFTLRQRLSHALAVALVASVLTFLGTRVVKRYWAEPQSGDAEEF